MHGDYSIALIGLHLNSFIFFNLYQAWISLKARETLALGRELLGGNGILADFLVAKVLPVHLFPFFLSDFIDL